MTREDRFLDVFGKIDDKYLVTALPGAFEPNLGTAVIHAGNNIEAVESTGGCGCNCCGCAAVG